MKKFLFFICALLTVFTSFSQAYVAADGALHPTGTFPVALAQEIKGAPKVANTLSDRDAIPANMRQAGMLCYVVANSTLYYLKSGTDNSAWATFSGGSSSGSNSSDSTSIAQLDSAINSTQWSIQQVLNIGNQYNKSNAFDIDTFRFIIHGKGTGAATGSSNIGLLVSPYTQQLPVAASIGVKNIRVGVNLSSGSLNTHKAASDAGYHVHVTVNWKANTDNDGDGIIDGAFPTSAEAGAFNAAFLSYLTNNLAGYDAHLLTLENEENNQVYRPGMSVSDYLAELAAALPVAHSHGYLMANGGLTGPYLIRWAYMYMKAHGLSAQADSLAAYNFAAGQIAGLATWESNSSKQRGAAIMDSLVTAYATLDMDFVNFHYYGPGDADNSVADYSGAGKSAVWIAQALQAATGKTAICDELGQENDEAAAPGAELAALTATGMPYIFWYSGDGSSARALQNSDNSLRDAGNGFKTFLSGYNANISISGDDQDIFILNYLGLDIGGLNRLKLATKDSVYGAALEMNRNADYDNPYALLRAHKTALDGSFDAQSDINLNRYGGALQAYENNNTLGTADNANVDFAPSIGVSLSASRQISLYSYLNEYNINGAVYSFPDANAAGVLTNDGDGGLSWSPVSSSSSLPANAAGVLTNDGNGSISWLPVSGTAAAVSAKKGAIMFGNGGGYTSDSASFRYDSTTKTLTLNQRLIKNDPSLFNYQWGTQNMPLLTTGIHNIAIGDSALYTLTTGYNNIAIGDSALASAITSNWDIAIGPAALANNTTGTGNVAIGGSAMKACTTCNTNLAVGVSALQGKTTGVPFTGLYNTGIGTVSLYFITTGQANTALGYFAGYNITSGSDNSMFGVSAGRGMQTASRNMAIGRYTLWKDTLGNENIGVGYQSGYSNVRGNNNTYVGTNAGFSDTSANNTFIGWHAGYSNTKGSGNIAIGYNVSPADPTANNQLTIGNLIYGTGADGQNNSISSGNVGIKTAAPRYSLDVNGDFAASGKIKINPLAGATSDTLLLWRNSDSTVRKLGTNSFIFNSTSLQTGGAYYIDGLGRDGSHQTDALQVGSGTLGNGSYNTKFMLDSATSAYSWSSGFRMMDGQNGSQRFFGAGWKDSTTFVMSLSAIASGSNTAGLAPKIFVIADSTRGEMDIIGGGDANRSYMKFTRYSGIQLYADGNTVNTTSGFVSYNARLGVLSRTLDFGGDGQSTSAGGATGKIWGESGGLNTANLPGGDVEVRGGLGTGTANGGSLLFKTAAAFGSSGTTYGTAVTRMTIKYSGIINFAYTPAFADNASAIGGGLVTGDIYRLGDGLGIVH